MLPVGMSLITASEKRIDLLMAGTFLFAARHVLNSFESNFFALLRKSPTLNIYIPLFRSPSAPSAISGIISKDFFLAKPTISSPSLIIQS